ncbi:hypothetical protein E4U13_000508 [Claviceps humidiphila]|uniref:Uncharacterized protein n=1 Tax=Claviceps humidiphila TaxID=1294629 RepID=A0A9P7Q433_9HYPO|nr:hypothetical protein E4U13_000508 [Claviceps humidiphila]
MQKDLGYRLLQLSVPLTGLHTDAGRWLEKIKWAFQLANDGQDADPSTFIQATYRSAVIYMNSSENLRHIVRHADQGLATQTDLVIFQRFLTHRYCPTVVDIQPDYYPSVEFYQDEPLVAYHSRVLTTLHRAGGRDKPLSTTTK